MHVIMGSTFALIGLGLIATRDLSARLHERWNQRFWWTRWATGPSAMQWSRRCNAIVGVAFIVYGTVLLVTR